MKPANIDLLGIFQEADDGTVAALDQVFGGQARGTNTYCHMNDTTLGFVGQGSALSQSSQANVTALINSMAALGVNHYYLNVGLEPSAGYDYALGANGRTITSQLASDLAGYQQQAKQNSAQLDIYVRFASEMNLGSYPANGDPHVAYVNSFHAVSSWLKTGNASIQMAFSPAINHETDDSSFQPFWPGPGFVDAVSCTWYFNGANPQATSAAVIANMSDYFLHRIGAAPKFGIDELGGWDATNQTNDDYLGIMFDGIAQLAGRVDLTYTTVFLQNAGPPPAPQWNHNPATLGL